MFNSFAYPYRQTQENSTNKIMFNDLKLKCNQKTKYHFKSGDYCLNSTYRTFILTTILVRKF